MCYWFAKKRTNDLVKATAATIGVISLFTARFPNFINRVPNELFQQVANGKRKRYYNQYCLHGAKVIKCLESTNLRFMDFGVNLKCSDLSEFLPN